MDATQECWLSIVGWEGYYEVSDHGRVRTVARIGTRRNGSQFPVVARILRMTTHKAGYKMVGLKADGRHSTVHVHRLVLDAFVGHLPDGFVTCHTNGDPGDNRLVNLRYDTPSANNYDKVRHGRDHNTEKTHCPQGHEYTPENIVPSSPGRRCRTCHNLRTRDCNRRRREKNRQIVEER